MGECCLTFIAAFIVTIGLIWWEGNKDKAQVQADKEENKSGSTDYIMQRDEIKGEIGGTNLDRFFIECVLAKCNDFNIEKNVAKAKLLAEKYNLSYSLGIENLYNRALEEHKEISDKINEDKLAEIRNKEKIEYNRLVKYADFYGRDKKKAILTDRMKELREKADRLDKGADLILKSGQKQESDWAVWGGIANGLGGVGAGVSTALDIQRQNAQIRKENEANMRAAMPAYMSISKNASKNRSNANAIQKEIDVLNEKLLSEQSSSEVMELLDVVNPTIEVSKTGAYKVSATIMVKEELFIYGDVPAVADGTILAHVYDGEKEIGTAKMVLPVEGVSSKAGIVGAGLSGAERGNSYEVKFSEYMLWLMEK